MKKYTIGQMSKLHRISIDTLRFYDKINLFKPKFVNNESHYRYYTADQFLKLERIKYFRKLNFSIDEIKEVIDFNNVELLKDKLSEGKKRVEEELSELHNINKRIDKNLDILNMLGNKENFNKIEIKEYKERYYISRELVDANNQDEVEVGIRELVEYFHEETFIFDAACAFFLEEIRFDKKEYMNHNKVGYIFDKVYKERVKNSKINTLEKGTYVSLIYEDDYRKNYIYYKKIQERLNEWGYKPSGEGFEIVHVDDSFGKENSSIIEIQIKVEKL